MRTLKVYELSEVEPRRLASFAFNTSFEMLAAFIAVDAISQAYPYALLHMVSERRKYVFGCPEMAGVIDNWRGFIVSARNSLRISDACYSWMSYILSSHGLEPLPSMV